MSIITQRYTSSPESAFDFDIRCLNNSEDIIASIDDEIARPLNERSLIENRGDVHHVFPKNYLKKNKHDNRGEYNQIANFAMLQTEVNIQISDRAPRRLYEDRAGSMKWRGK